MNPTETIAVLRRHGIRLAKRYGQHFLVDGNVLRNIVEAAAVVPGDSILEVGPGIGTLTEALLDAGAVVIAVEIDAKLREVLADTMAGRPVVVVAADAMQLQADDIASAAQQLAAGPLPPLGPAASSSPRRPSEPAASQAAAPSAASPARTSATGVPLPGKLVANLPYNIASPLIIEYFLRFPHLDKMIVMVQQEIAERILASPGSKDYGSFTVKLAYMAAARRVCHVSRRSFLPPPNVESTVVALERKKPLPLGEDPRHFLAFVDAAFASRRKMLRNSFYQGIERGVIHAPSQAIGPQAPSEEHLPSADYTRLRTAFDAALAQVGLTGKERAEELELSTFLRLYEAFRSDRRSDKFL